MPDARRFFTSPGTTASAQFTAETLTPMIEVEVHGANGSYGKNYAYDINQSLLSVQTVKSLSQPQGTATLQLTAGVFGATATTTWMDLLETMDLVIVRMSETGNDLYTVFVGYIDSVEDDLTATTPPQRSITVQCSDLMVGFIDANIFVPPVSTSVINPTATSAPQLSQTIAWTNLYQALVNANAEAQAANLPSGWLSFFLAALTGQTGASATALNPSQIIQIVVQNLMPILFAPTTTLRQANQAMQAQYLDFINLALSSTLQFGYASFNTSPLDGTLWSTCQSVTNPPFFEFFGDLRTSDETLDLLLPGNTDGAISGPASGTGTATTWGNHGEAFYVCFRPSPYSQNMWPRLVVKQAYPKDIVGWSLAKNRAQVINYYMAYPEGWNQLLTNNTVKLVFPGLADTESILQYGLSPLTVGLYGVFDLSQALPSPPALNVDFQYFSEWSQQLYEWYKKNPKLIQGGLVLRGNPRYRVGQRFQLMTDNKGTDVQLEGYIESVQHNFIMFGSYQTQLMISRGARVPNSQATPLPPSSVIPLNWNPTQGDS